MFYIKIHRKLGREIVAVCDEDILGKKFEDGDLAFDVKEDFYKGEKKSKEEIKDILIWADNINLVGKKIIAFALELHVIEEENIIKIKGIPHAQGIAL